MYTIDLNKKQEVKVLKSQNSKSPKLSLLKKTALIALILTALGILFLTTFKKQDLQYVVSHLVLKSSPNYLVKQTPINIYLDDNLSTEIRSKITNFLEKININESKRFIIQAERENADLVIDIDNKKSGVPISQLLFVGHFYWIKGDINLATFNNKVYVLENDNLAIKGASSYGYKIEKISKSELLSKLEKSEDIPALISPKYLSFEYKLLSINDKYYLDELKSGTTEYENGSLPLSLSISNTRDTPEFIKQSLKTNLAYALKEYKNTQNIFTINQTGVTAITRKLTTSVTTSGDGAYPAQNIGEFLADADLTHVSNEISFVNGCTNTKSMSFCSRPETIDSLILSGVDIVELTGNHNNDYGSDANTSSIEIYKELGWSYFGGGLNLEDAQKILYKNLPSGKKVAFIGYNYWNTHFGFTGALASEIRAGANPYSQDQMKADIADANNNADFVIVDLQFSECYSYPKGYVLYPICYKSTTVADQQETFRMAIDLGADMVVGTQAHQPQTYEIYEGKPIFYGLGNLYFDQAVWPGTRHGLVLTHYFLNGQYVQTKLTTTNYKEDLITYVSTGDERELLLTLLQQAR